jgi:dCMP deaminase
MGQHPPPTEQWDLYLLHVARAVAVKSKDPSTQVGALIVDSLRTIRATGYNGFPRGLADDGRLADRAAKLLLVAHAEANAICTAARVGIRLDECSLYSTLHPCSRCAALIIQAGLGVVVIPDYDEPARWAEDFAVAAAMFDEAGVRLRRVGPCLRD